MKKMLIGIGITLVGVVVMVAGIAIYKNANVERRSFEVPDGYEEKTMEENEVLIANAENEDAAEKIAKLYGIVLISYDYKVATYANTSGKNAAELIKWGEENGYPAISLNHIQSID